MIETLFPAGIAVASAPPGACVGALHPEEESAIARSVEKRRQEFALGRSCARQALSRLGARAGAVPVRADRSPAWPEGVVGAITHCERIAAAAVGWRRSYAGIGLDVELADPLEATLGRLICTAAEQEWHAAHAAPRGTGWTKLAFSAKESIHKAVAPLTGVRLGFHDVEVEFDADAGRFAASLTSAGRTRLAGLGTLEGRFAVIDGLVVTAVTIAADDDHEVPAPAQDSGFP